MKKYIDKRVFNSWIPTPLEKSVAYFLIELSNQREGKRYSKARLAPHKPLRKR